MSKYGDDRTNSGIKGTPAYLAPETIKGSKYSAKSDVYSMGIIIWELAYRCLHGEHMEPYENIRSSGLQLLYKVAADGIRPQVPPSCPHEIKVVVDSCLGNEVNLRPDFSVLVERLRGIEKVYNANKEAWDDLRQAAPPFVVTSSPISSASPSTVSSIDETSSYDDSFLSPYDDNGYPPHLPLDPPAFSNDSGILNSSQGISLSSSHGISLTNSQGVPYTNTLYGSPVVSSYHSTTTTTTTSSQSHGVLSLGLSNMSLGGVSDSGSVLSTSQGSLRSSVGSPRNA